METAHQTGYGVKNGRLIHVSEASRGLACGCVCVACGQALVAKKGHQRRHHFSHAADVDCQGAAETALHLLSKELFGELSHIILPPYYFVKERKLKAGTVVKHQQLIAKGGTVSIKGVRIESRETGFIPDVVLDCGTKNLIVEIAVTHKVDRDKMRHIRRREWPAIEIRLDFSDALLPRDELRSKLQDDLRTKLWLFHPVQREAERAFFLKLRLVQRANRRTQDVPETPVPKTRLPTTIVQMRQPTFAPNLNEYDKTAEAFYRVHQRYPTTEECIRLWPHLWEKR